MYQCFMYEQYLAHLFGISLNCKESRQTGTQPITIFRIFAGNLTLNNYNYEEMAFMFLCILRMHCSKID